MCSSSAPPVGKKLSFTPLALATSIAALALSAPKVPHMSSMVIATRGLVVGPVRIHGGNGRQQALQRATRRDRRHRRRGWRDRRLRAAAGGPASATQPELRRGRGRTDEARLREELPARELGPVTLDARVGTPR